jgi:hypothetical protein
MVKIEKINEIERTRARSPPYPGQPLLFKKKKNNMTFLVSQALCLYNVDLYDCVPLLAQKSNANRLNASMYSCSERIGNPADLDRLPHLINTKNSSKRPSPSDGTTPTLYLPCFTREITSLLLKHSPSTHSLDYLLRFL